MATTRREVIRKKALEMLDGRPTGIRYSELVRLLHDALPGDPSQHDPWQCLEP